MIPDRRAEERSPRPRPQHALSVTAIVSRARRSLEQDYRDVWVAGELAEWRHSPSGHRYLVLRDSTAQLAGVMFRGEAEQLPLEPEPGWEVLVRGTVTVFPQRGTLQIKVREVRLQDERGLRQIAIDRLRDRLRDEGLLELDRKRRLPRCPDRIGIVTSPDGAALQDVISVLTRRWPCGRVVVYPTVVQGRGSEHHIAAAIRSVSPDQVDVVIIARGGGSAEDLWPFNTELVAWAVAECSVPTITAIGHETDTSIADLVSDLRAPTPSAAAELVAPDRSTVLAAMDRLRRERGVILENLYDRETRTVRETRDRLRTGLASSLGLLEERLGHTEPAHLLARVDARVRVAGEAIRGNHPAVHAATLHRMLETTTLRLVNDGAPALYGELGRRVDEAGWRLASSDPRVMGRTVSALAEQASARLDGLGAELRALSPEATLRRGYAIPLDRHGRVLRSAEDVVPGDEVSIRMANGLVRATAISSTTSGDTDANAHDRSPRRQRLANHATSSMPVAPD